MKRITRHPRDGVQDVLDVDDLERGGGVFYQSQISYKNITGAERRSGSGPKGRARLRLLVLTSYLTFNTFLSTTILLNKTPFQVSILEFFRIGKSDRSVRSDRDERHF